MALLTAAQVHLDVPLQNLTVAYMQSTSGFVSDKVFPLVSVEKKSDKYYIYNRADFNRVGEVQKRAPRTRAPQVSLSLSTDSYFAEVRSLGASLDFETMANEDTALDIEFALTQSVLMRMQIDKELQWVDAFFKPGVWATDWTGVSGVPAANQVRQWSDYINSTPITDVVSILRTMLLRSGGVARPDGITMVMGREVRDQLINHPTIINRLNGGATPTNTALVTDAKLAEIFGVKQMLIMDAVQNTAAEGLTEALSFIGGKSVAFYWTPPAAGKMVASAGYTFVWDGLEKASGYGLTINSYSGDWLAREGIAKEIEVNMAYDHKVIGTELGSFIATVIA
jgi:hypothetical protein